jgi:hypothetical protein
VIETAIADVVGPAVSANQPNTFLDQEVGDGKKLPRVGGTYALQFFF